jgi:hypothetical protein
MSALDRLRDIAADWHRRAHVESTYVAVHVCDVDAVLSAFDAATAEVARLTAALAAAEASVAAERELRREHGQRIGWAESVAASAMRQGLDALTLMRERRERLWARVRAAEATEAAGRGRYLLRIRHLTSELAAAEGECARLRAIIAGRETPPSPPCERCGAPHS